MASTGEAWRLGRRPALDGLRGIAALVVVVHHTLLLSPAIARFYDPSGPRAHWVTYTPLRLLWAGEVAVAVFFVLSGYVLARPFLAGCGSAWRTYYPKRLVRLYLPVWAAVALAATLLALVPRSASTGRSWWVDMQAMSVSAHSIVWNLVLLGGTDQLDNPLWSLRWEVLFSLALPLYVVAVVALRRYPAVVGLAALMTLTLAGSHLEVDGLRYLPVFALGALLADREPQIIVMVERLGRYRWVLGLVAIGLMTTTMYAAQAGGAVVLLVWVLAGARPATFLSSPGPVSLGRVSFSLYLVHVPLIVAVATLFPGWSAGALLVPLLALALVVGAGFWWLVERPSQRLAQRASRRTAAAPRLGMPGQVTLNQSTM